MIKSLIILVEQLQLLLILTGVSKSYPLVRLPSDKEEDHIPYNYYSALMGLLASSGARLEHGPNWIVKRYDSLALI